MEFGVVLLAAGGSSRLGRPKQLLAYLGRTLVEHAARTALAAGAGEVVVVVGAEAPAVRKALHGLKVRIVENSAWAEGIGRSIAFGIAALKEGIDAAVVALCDQPRITPVHLRALAQRVVEGRTSIVASSYDGVRGAPCAFARSEFHRLLALTGDVGARHLIRGVEIETIDFSGANVDIDTPDDYRALVPEDAMPTRAAIALEPDDARAPPAM